MNETNIDLDNAKSFTVSVKDNNGETNFMVVRGKTEEDVERQFNTIIDHETAHLIADQMMNEWAMNNGYTENFSETAKSTMDKIMDEPAGDVPLKEHAINLQSGGKVVAAAVIRAANQLKAVRLLMNLAHQPGRLDQARNDNDGNNGAGNVGTFGQPIDQKSIDAQLNDPEFFNKLIEKNRGSN